MKIEFPSTVDKKYQKHFPFADSLLDFCQRLSKEFFGYPQINNYPDLLALAYWLRKAHLIKMKDKFENYECLRVPRGIAFHIPPSNVDAMFVYSWILSLLVGNANIIRLPTKRSANMEILFDVIRNALNHFPSIDEATELISYGHEEEITRELSLISDIRIIWGGDATVERIRQIPLKPMAKEIVFPDRFSMAAINSQKYLTLSSEERKSLAQKFFNDVYWFDQQACSSTRLLVWVGQQRMNACEEFYHHLNELLEAKKHEIALSHVMMKKTFLTHQAMSVPIKLVKSFSNELTIIEIEDFSIEMRNHCGNGVLYELKLDTLEQLIPYIIPKDQTLAYFGFSKAELSSLAKKLNGRGLDRMVPIGQSLNFDYIWDGYDLLQELTKVCTI